MPTPTPISGLLLGTRNAGKVHEIRTLLGTPRLNLRSLIDFPGVAVAPEDASTYEENAIAKAQFYAAATGLCALADDSGLEVAALGGIPGVHSARYAGDSASDADRRSLLLRELRKCAASNREARFVCFVAIVSPEGEVLNLSSGECRGRITEAARGESGFGYDPIFIPDGYEETFGELDEAVKNAISHRARALSNTKVFLETLAG
jgi:XTP/dITP diphosphohydrolase